MEREREREGERRVVVNVNKREGAEWHCLKLAVLQGLRTAKSCCLLEQRPVLSAWHDIFHSTNKYA